MNYTERLKEAQKTMQEHDIMIRDAAGRGFDEEVEKIAAGESKLFNLFVEGPDIEIKKTASAGEKRKYLMETLQKEAMLEGVALEMADIYGYEYEKEAEENEGKVPPLNLDTKKEKEKEDTKKKTKEEKPELDLDKKEKEPKKKVSSIARFLNDED